MDLALFSLAFAMFLKMTHAILCYKCEAERLYDKNMPTPLCEHFDYTEKYVTDCPNSTGCVKKVTELTTLGEITQSVERGCAKQTMDGDQVKVNGRWEPANRIHEAYEVGCNEESSELGKLTKGTNCFCRGNLCNSADNLTKSWSGFIGALVLWMILK